MKEAYKFNNILYNYGSKPCRYHPFHLLCRPSAVCKELDRLGGTGTALLISVDGPFLRPVTFQELQELI